MVKRMFYYLLGILLAGALIAYLTSFVIGYLPYVLSVLLVMTPIYGVIRHKSSWTRTYGVKSILNMLKPIFKFEKSNISFYLLLGVIVGFLHNELAYLIITSLIASILTIISVLLLWEGARKLAVKKGYSPVSFFEAVKKAM